jgi:predicted ferric reductase
LLQNRRRPVWLLDLHRWLGGLALVFTGLHLVGLVTDSYEHFGIREILVPFASEWRPVAVAGGVFSLYLLAGIQITSLLMRHLPRRLWKSVHFMSFPLFFLASIHSATAGSDTARAWYRVGSVAVITATLFTILYRLLTGKRRRVDRRTAMAVEQTPEALADHG